MNGHQNDAEFESKLEISNLAFFLFFLFEIIVNLIGRGFKYYFSETFNYFDVAVIIVSAVDILMKYTTVSDNGTGALTALRVLRIIRLLRFARQLQDFNQLLKAIRPTFADISNISILLLLFIFAYTLVGLELYAYKIDNQANNIKIDETMNYYKQSESNFNTFIESFLSVFIVLSNNGWSRIFYDHYRATDGITTSFFFLSLLTFGQFILVNLFVAIIIQNFEFLSVKFDIINRFNKIHRISSWEKAKMSLCFWKNYS